MSKLYEELREIAVHDATVYHFLKHQSAANTPDLETAIAIIKQLSKEKKFYFNDAVKTRDLSIVPILASSKDDLIITASNRQLLRELEGQKLWFDLVDDKKRNKTKWRLEAVPISIIQNKLKEIE